MNQAVLRDPVSGRWLRFHTPRQVIVAYALDDVALALARVEEAVNGSHLHAAGFISYEAAPAFDAALAAKPPCRFPLLWFGLYDEPEVIDFPAASPRVRDGFGEWTASGDRAAYDGCVARIKEHIARGESYQVNYTFRLRSSLRGDPWEIFAGLVAAQQAPYPAYIETADHVICSTSPELFFELDGSDLTCRPMKGTAARGRTTEEDDARRRSLHRSRKNRAENVMIVDMIRSDMGRVARFGSVSAPRLFQTERYPTLWQMTSTVTAKTDAPVNAIIAALFPCASVTGAPKAFTTGIIAALETTPRRIYTGCIGHIAPGRKACFSVAIRTLLIDKGTARAEYGVGSGIVWDSAAGSEYDECFTKAKVLAEAPPAFSLLESVLWTPGEGCFLLEEHCARLRASARYFGFPVSISEVRSTLRSLTLAGGAHKVRLLVDSRGAVTCQSEPLVLPAMPQPALLALAGAPVDSGDPFLFHKTTNRRAYEAALATVPPGHDALLWNERGEVTETSIANIIVKWDGELVTPPVRCGLLPGTFRAHLLKENAVREQVIPVDTLTKCSEIWVVNSVRRWRRAVFSPPLPSPHRDYAERQKPCRGPAGRGEGPQQWCQSRQERRPSLFPLIFDD